jgi:hypothetical protein
MEMNPHVFMTGGVGGERLRALFDFCERVGKLRHPPLNRVLMGFKPRIVLDKFGFLRH